MGPSAAMCGITGYAAGRPTAIGPWFADAIACVSHRGPDRERGWARGDDQRSPMNELAGTGRVSDVALGFARLAIIDLSEASDQPFVEPGRAALAFNGEIYNYVELREELVSRGWRFDTSGDVEVLLKGYLEWGIGVLPRLNGMFALAIHDESRDTLLLARDRFGEKPLFWTEWGGGIAFASEIKQLAQYPGVELELNPDAVDRYLVTGRPYLGFSSWFRGVSQVPPGGWLEIDGEGRRSGSYFDLRAEIAAVEPASGAEEWAERFSAAWQQAVTLRLRSDVPVGTSLSSGVDSAAVLVEAVAIGHERYHAFTLRYDEGRDEGNAAQALADSAGATWHPVWGVGKDFAESWDRMTWHHETPVDSGSLFGQWKVFEAAHAAGIRVILDGQGSDEVLGGYHKFYASHVVSRIRAAGPLAIMDVARFGRQAGLRPLLERAISRGRLGTGVELGRSYRSYDGPSGPPLLGLTEMRLADIEVWSLPNLLAYADRNAMAHNVETRLPFLDPGVAVLSLAMPGEVLYRNGWTKWPLRRHLALRGADEPAWRRGKRWFDLPTDPWLQRELRPALVQLASEPHPAWAEFVDPAALQRHVSDTGGAPGPASGQDLMRLLALERFFRVWFPQARAQAA
jgi:asparagine synthase (glutamine-hydrolysing)